MKKTELLFEAEETKRHRILRNVLALVVLVLFIFAMIYFDIESY